MRACARCEIMRIMVKTAAEPMQDVVPRKIEINRLEFGTFVASWPCSCSSPFSGDKEEEEK